MFLTESNIYVNFALAAGLAVAQQLTRAGHTVAVYERADKPGGLLRWLTTTNHKDIGTLYLIFAVFAGIIGGGISGIMRLELAQAGALQVRVRRDEIEVPVDGLHGGAQGSGAAMLAGPQGSCAGGRRPVTKRLHWAPADRMAPRIGTRCWI